MANRYWMIKFKPWESALAVITLFVMMAHPSLLGWFAEQADKLLLTSTALATAYAALSASRSARSAEGTRLDLQNTSERELRAYITIKDSSVILRKGNQKRLDAHVTIQNTGKTPAYSFETWCRLAIDEVSSRVFESDQGVFLLRAS